MTAKYEGSGGIREVTKSERPGSEKREHTRVPVRMPANVCFSSWQVFRLMYTMNISRGGLLFQMDKEPPKDLAIDLTLDLPNGSKVLLPARVRHATQSGAKFQVGVEFVAADDEQQRVLSDAMLELGKAVLMSC